MLDNCSSIKCCSINEKTYNFWQIQKPEQKALILLYLLIKNGECVTCSILLAEHNYTGHKETRIIYLFLWTLVTE